MRNIDKAGKWVIVSILLVIILALITYCVAKGQSSAKSFETDLPGNTEYLYIIKEYDGKVAVFSNGRDTPDEIYDTYISSLPETDRNYLEAGIGVNSGQELESIIEDLTS